MAPKAMDFGPFHGGANGVMIFFVLSGFILSHVYRNQFVAG
jgi:peptidoglycan/LPS O-acetylase OafA/YrhL